MPVVTQQELENAALDVATLAAFANGSGMVDPRQGADYPSLRQWLADRQADIDENTAASAALAQYIGRVAMLFRTGAATANSLATVTAGGAASAYKITDLYILPTIEANTSPNVVVSIDGLPAKPLLTNTGDLLPVPAWGVLSNLGFRYRQDIDSFVMVMNDYVEAGENNTPFVIASTAISDGGDPKMLKVTPKNPPPDNTGYSTFYLVRFPDDRPAEVGMQIKIVGFNDAEYLGLWNSDAVTQVPDGAFKAGDIGLITRDPGNYRLYIAAIFPRVPAASGAAASGAAASNSMGDLFTRKNSVIRALSSFGK